MKKRNWLLKIKKHLIFFLFAGIVMMGFESVYPSSYAATNYEGTVNGTGCRVRSTNSTSGSIVATLNAGHAVTIIDKNRGSDGYIWYKITFTVSGISKTGWMRSDLIDVKTVPTSEVKDADFEAQLDAQGFPESYKAYLRTLHELHPSWVFKAYQTGLNWNEVIAGELEITSRNLVPASNPSSWKSLAAGAYDWENDSWYEYEKGWAAASKELVEYCMDPRNFLKDDEDILMFQSLSWNESETVDNVRLILEGTIMQGDFPNYFINAGKTYGVSAYHLAARADQETNGGRSGSVSGTYKNYFNINATGSNPVQAAVTYAQSQGWDTAEKSIMGGAAFIAKGYISVGQDTLYLQKFDVVAAGGYYWHQYMGNVLAPQHEATKLGKVLDKIGWDSEIVFTIPVYNSMPNEACPLPTEDGNPNNLLESLSVNGCSLTPAFNKFVNSYDIIVPTGTTTVNISASPVQSSSSVSGAGTVGLKAEGTTTVNILVTPTYGESRTYTINITVSDDASNSNVSSSTYMAGDPNGDSTRNVVDLVLIKRHIVGIDTLTGDAYNAADINKDGNINVQDLVLLKQCIVGLRSLD